MMRKPQRASGYTAEQTERAEQVLLEVWSHLGDFHEQLVLVGGLAPRYLVPQDLEGVPKHCGTLDVDFAVSLAVAKAAAAGRCISTRSARARWAGCRCPRAPTEWAWSRPRAAAGTRGAWWAGA